MSVLAYGMINRALPPWVGALGTDSGEVDSPSRRARHAKIGALVGGGFGLGIGLLAGAAGEGLNADGADGGKIVVAAIGSTVLFAVVGAGIGALFP